MIQKLRDLLHSKYISKGAVLSTLRESYTEDPAYHNEIVIPYMKDHFPSDFEFFISSPEELKSKIEVCPLPVFGAYFDQKYDSFFEHTTLLQYLRTFSYCGPCPSLRIWKTVLMGPHLENIRTLSLTGFFRGRSFVKPLFENFWFSKLENLSLDKVKVGNLFHELNQLSDLSYLMATKAQIGDSDFIRFCLGSTPSNLKYLDVSDNNISSDGLQGMTSFPQLEVLRISGNMITDEGLENTLTREAFPKLKFLEVREMGISKGVTQFLLQNTNISQVSR